MSWDYVPGKNAEGYPDPTAAAALSNVQRSQRGLQSKRAGEHFENMIAATLSDRGQQVSRSDVGPILTKAQAAGLIRNAGKRDCSVTGRSAIAWKAEKEVFHGNKPNHKGNPAGEL